MSLSTSRPPGSTGSEDKNVDHGLRSVVKRAWMEVTRAGNFEGRNCPSYGLTDKQIRRTSHLTLILSAPIEQLEKAADGEFYPTGPVIWVLNIDSSREGALAYYEATNIADTDISLGEVVPRTQEEMALLCSRIMN